MEECLGKILNPSSVKMRVAGEREILWRDMGRCNWKRERVRRREKERRRYNGHRDRDGDKQWEGGT